LLNVVDMLYNMVEHLEALVRSGSSEERLSWCQEITKEMETVKAEHAYVDEEPHSWALGEAAREIEWLCVNWVPERRDELPEHAQMMHEVMEMYEERLTCMPGDVYCSPQGHVGGYKPNCHCACNAGWTGMACEEQASAACDLSGSWTGSNDGATTVLDRNPANHCAGQASTGAWTFTVDAAGTTVTLSDGTTGTIAGTKPGRTITWSNGITYTEQGR